MSKSNIEEYLDKYLQNHEEFNAEKFENCLSKLENEYSKIEKSIKTECIEKLLNEADNVISKK